MNSFTLHAVGHLVRNPEVITKGDLSYVTFGLIGADYCGESDGMVREMHYTVWFLAYNEIAVELLSNVRKGDQLILQARPRTVCKIESDGTNRYEVDFVVTGFRYGAKKGGDDPESMERSRTPPPIMPPSMQAMAAVSDSVRRRVGIHSRCVANVAVST